MKLAPKSRIHAPKRFRIQTTYCQAKLPTVRQAFSRYETCTQQPHTCTQTFPHTDYLLSGNATYCQAKLPTVRQAFSHYETSTQKPHTCTQTFPQTCTQHPHTLHPNVSAYMHPTSAYFFTQHLIYPLCQHMDVLVFHVFVQKNATRDSIRLLGACMRLRLGACMRLLGASLRRRLGAKYAVVGCKFHNG